MKTKNLFLILLAILSCHPARAHEGVTVRGGGDDAALEFTNAFHAAMAEIEQNQPDLKVALASYDTEAMLSHVSIFVLDEALLVPAGEGTQASVADNEPATLSIRLNRGLWREVGHTRIREAIALHEVYSLAGAEGPGFYPYSAAYLAKFHLRNDPFVFVAGRDPALASAKFGRTTCERKNEASSRSAAEASWRILNKNYKLSYEFKVDSAGRFSGVLRRDTAKRSAHRENMECTTSDTNAAAWLGIVGEPRLAIEIEKLNARAVLVTEAERAFRFCAGATCAGLKTALAEEAEKFAAAWQKISSNQRAKMRATIEAVGR